MNALSFFNPAFLWALAFLAVPIIIHFLRRKQTVKLTFSTLRFLKQTAVHASRLRWLQNLLLLLSRLLLVSIIVLLFAQPFNREDPFRIISSSNTALYIWIDPTISMGYTENNKSLWEEAGELAGVFDTVLHAAAKVYCYDGRVDDFIAIPPKGMAAVLPEQVTPLRHGMSDFERMCARFNAYRKNDSRTAVLVIISDFQAKDTGMFTEFLSNSVETTPCICVTVSPENPWNYSLSDTRILFDDTPELTCLVTTCNRTLNGTVVALIQSMRAGQERVAVKRNDSMTVTIDIGSQGSGASGEVRLVESDPYRYDNTGYFVSSRSAKKRILILTESDESFSLEAALESIAGEYWYPPRVIHSVAVTYDDLDSSDVIILSSIREPTSVLATLWGKSALSNKLVVFAPSIGKYPGSLNSIIFQHLGRRAGVKKIKTEKPCFPVLPDTVSTLWRGFPRFSDKDVAIYTCYTPLPGKVLLRMNNGLPFATHCIDSNGSAWIVFATPIGITEANNLSETGFYVPALDRLIRYGYESVIKNHAVWIAGKEVSNPFAGTRLSAQIFNNHAKQIATWDRQAQVMLEMPGLYKIQPSAEPAYWIAAVSDPTEGDCRYQLPVIKAEDTRKIKILNRSSFMHFIQNHKTPGFDYLWILLAVCVFCEVLFWKRKKRVKAA